jgi:opacity protein-like surface antigen
MKKLFVLCAALLCLSFSAAAQESVAAFDAASPAAEPAAPAPSNQLTPSDREPWQAGLGFQYQHYNVLGQNFHDLGYNTQVTRFINNWFGVEGTVAMGWGSTGTNPNLDAKSLFLGGGPHVAWDNHSRFEPFVHVLVGWQHFRFTQTSTGFGSNSALGFMGGGGVDYKLGPRMYIRVQGDYVGTHFTTKTSNEQSNYSVGTGVVFNF